MHKDAKGDFYFADAIGVPVQALQAHAAVIAENRDAATLGSFEAASRFLAALDAEGDDIAAQRLMRRRQAHAPIADARDSTPEGHYSPPARRTYRGSTFGGGEGSD